MKLLTLMMVNDLIIHWFLSGDTGVSSQTIVAAAYGVPTKIYRGDAPHDPADFGRCYRLLRRYPMLRALAFPSLARRAEWKWIVRCWDDLEKVYRRDLPTGRSHELFCIIQALRGDRL